MAVPDRRPVDLPLPGRLLSLSLRVRLNIRLSCPLQRKADDPGEFGTFYFRY